MAFDSHQMRRVNIDQYCFIFNILLVEKILHILLWKSIIWDMHLRSNWESSSLFFKGELLFSVRNKILKYFRIDWKTIDGWDGGRQLHEWIL